MVILRCNVHVKKDKFAQLYEELVAMYERGVILLPPSVELLNEVPPDTQVVVVSRGNGKSTATYEAIKDYCERSK